MTGSAHDSEICSERTCAVLVIATVPDVPRDEHVRSLEFFRIEQHGDLPTSGSGGQTFQRSFTPAVFGSPRAWRGDRLYRVGRLPCWSIRSLSNRRIFFNEH